MPFQKRKISTSSEDDDESWNTSLAVHETPSGEGEEFLCPYFDGSKLILPPGYEDYKKKVEKDDQVLGSCKEMFGDTPRTTSTDGTPLRRSTRKTRTRKRMYIYSDDDSSSGFEDSKITAAMASGAPVPTCMFVNAGVAGGSGIDVNKDVFKSLPQTKVLTTSASQCADDERIEFTIEINETSDDESSGQADGVDGSKSKQTLILPDESENTSTSNINGLNESNTDLMVAAGPDIKIKDDPIFLSDDEVVSNDSVKNEKENEVVEEGEQSKESDTLSSQEKTLESNDSDSDKKEESESKRVDLKDKGFHESVRTVEGENGLDATSKDESQCSSSIPGDATEKNSITDSSSRVVKRNDCDDLKKGKLSEGHLTGNSNSESSRVGDNTNSSDSCTSKIDDDEKNENMCSKNITEAPKADENELIGIDKDVKTEGEDNSLSHTGMHEKELVNVSNSETKQLSKNEDALEMTETEEIKSEGADTEKTEEFEPEAEHALITEIKERMKGYCSQRVEFVETLELSGNLTINADNEKPIRGSVAQTIIKDKSTRGEYLLSRVHKTSAHVISTNVAVTLYATSVQDITE